MRKVFINRYDQLRSGWKIIIVTVLAIIFVNIPAALYSGTGDSLLLLFMQSLGFILAIWLTLKFVDRGKMRDIGMTPVSGQWGSLAAGLSAGAVSMTAVFLILMWTGNAHVIHSSGVTGNWAAIAYGPAAFALVALGEELLFRGYYISALQQLGNFRISAILSSALFALAHLGNQGVSLLAEVNIFLVGLMLAYMYFKTGSLWMPIGFHFTWNYFQGSVYGLSVSGHELHSILVTSVKDNILTGGSFGPEGGLLASVVILLSILSVSLYKIKAA